MKMRLQQTLLAKRRFLVLPLDLALAWLAFHLAGALRFESFDPRAWETMSLSADRYLALIGLLLATKGLLFVAMGLYRSLWAYASTHDLLQILKATVASSAAFVAVLLFYNRMDGVARSVLILDGGITFLFLSFRSFSWRIARDVAMVRFSRVGRRTLLVGAGIAATRLIMELRSHGSREHLPVALVDEDAGKIGGHLMGLPVIGSHADLNQALTDYRIEEVIITSKPSTEQLRQIYRTCEERGIECKTLPPLSEVLRRKEIGTALRNISLEDLLGREVVRLDTAGIQKALSNQTVLISGAGGSIGKEVCRQIIAYGPKAMILLDSAETPLYEIDYELRNQPTDGHRPQFITIVGDVRDERHLRSLFAEHDVHAVFHCAAYKHVPMMELNPGEAVLNNISGTCRLANAARDAGVDRFVMISTDKAVNPVNIMGATKRIAELYIQNLSRATDTKFITVRFGNVLGSNGSVIPLFKRQIEKGGPLTVTHPEIIRYFMTIEEAAGLVIQAGVMGEGGEIFILDMGQPVKIKTLAEDMIRFSGLIPHQDIEIRYVGLRPGEKLFEELLLDGEGIQPTHHKKIHIALARNVNFQTLQGQIERLEQAAGRRDRAAVDELIGSILPEYKPVYTLKAPERQPRSEPSEPGQPDYRTSEAERRSRRDRD